MHNKNNAILSLKDRNILDKHSNDLIRLLIKKLLAIETEPIAQEDKLKVFGMLAEYFSTREMLNAE